MADSGSWKDAGQGIPIELVLPAGGDGTELEEFQLSEYNSTVGEISAYTFLV